MTLSKSQIKSITNLRLKKYRNIENKFFVEGERTVREGLNSGYKYDSIYTTQDFLDKNHAFQNEFQNIIIISKKDFQKISDTNNPQGVAAVFNKQNQLKDWANDIISELVVCLENVSDPGNVGTIIRNCDWFGVKNLVLSNTCADVYNSKTIRATMGSVFHINIFFSNNLINDLSNLKNKGYKILSASLSGKNVFNFKPDEKTIVIFGNEANGISKDVFNISDELITIPKLGSAESLNVANAASVILAELTK